MSNNTQLPADWVDKLNTEALEKYPVQLHRVQHGLPTDLKEYERQLWLAGATEYAIKLLQAEQEIALLKEVNNESLKLTEKAQEVNFKMRALLEKFIYRHEGGLLPDRFLYNDIKTFLDGK